MAKAKLDAEWEVGLWLREHLKGSPHHVEGQVKFLPDRKFRWDWAVPSLMLAVEVDGLVWSGRGGGHQRPLGYVQDRTKDLEGILAGWLPVRLATSQVRDGTAFLYLEKIITMLVQKRAK